MVRYPFRIDFGSLLNIQTRSFIRLCDQHGLSYSQLLNFPEGEPQMKVIGYVDGMNFYEAGKHQRWYPAGWCNWTQTLREYCPAADVTVRYFTTLYTGSDRKRARRQELHLLAMREEAKAVVDYGSLRPRDLRCPRCDHRLKCPECGCHMRYTEKMTDVKIALRLLEDAVDSLFDRAYLVSADVDLIPAVRAALDRASEAKIFVLLPPNSVKDEEFANLERDYPGRSQCDYLDLGRMIRFSDDLPRRWNMRLPEHWRKNAGPRPENPDNQMTSPRSKPTPSWVKESAGYGAEAVVPGRRDAPAMPALVKKRER